MTSTIILIITIVVLFLVSYFSINKCIQYSKEKKLLENELAKKDESIAYLYKHAEEISKLDAEKKKLKNEVENAKTDKEIANIIAAIVDANNSKLHVY